MRSRHTLAQLVGCLVLSAGAAAVSGCYLFHEREPSVATPGPAGSRDAGRVSDTGTGTPSHRDAGVVVPAEITCAPADAHIPACATTLCGGSAGWAFWDGTECQRVACDCTGADCTALVPYDTCVATHAHCAPALCGATGGTWLSEHSYCGSFVCGHPAPDSCEIGTPACDCGIGRSFDEVRGCFDDDRCTRFDLCEATGGERDSCDTTCDGPCPPPDPGDRRAGCNCGLGRSFDEVRGCFVDPSCARNDESLCRASGGTWGGAWCCHTTCGRPCPDPCASPACACGVQQVFEPGRGCVDSRECLVRIDGEMCNIAPWDGSLTCAPGLVCCEQCGVAGCGSLCRAPCCGEHCNTDTGCPDAPEGT